MTKSGRTPERRFYLLSVGTIITVDGTFLNQPMILPVYFDPTLPISDLSGNLPHWRQDNTTYFVTFRTVDSLPQEKLDLWLLDRQEWLKNNPEPHTAEQKQEFYERFPRQFQQWLDQGYGA